MIKLYAVFVLLCLLVPVTFSQNQTPADDNNFFKINDLLLKNMPPKEKNEEEEEDGYLAQYNRWYHLWRFRLGPYGDMSSAQKEMQLFQNQKNFKTSTACESSADDAMIWTNLGPFESSGSVGYETVAGCMGEPVGRQNQGRVESITVHPNNPNEILIGGWNGGIWRSTDGGATWHNTTDDEGYSTFGCNKFLRHPQNPDIIYAATSLNGGMWESFRDVYGIGVIISEDGGITWTQTSLINYTNRGVLSMAIDPSSTLSNTIFYASTDMEVLKWEGNYSLNGNWASCFFDGNYQNGPLWWGFITNIELEVDSLGNAWFGNFNGLHKIATGTDTAIAVTNYTVPTPFSGQAPCGANNQSLRQDISIETNKLGHLFFIAQYSTCTTSGPNDHPFLYTSTDYGNTWSYIEMNTFKSQIPKKFTVSLYNSNVIYTETKWRCMLKSTNGGLTFTNMNNTQNHADIRCLLPYDGQMNDSLGLQDVIYATTDGGVSKTTDGYEWKDMTGYGLSITNFYGVGITEQTDRYILGGAQDGSINFYVRPNWHASFPGGDNGDCLISPYDSTRAYQEFQNYLVAGDIDIDYINTYSPPISLPFSWTNPMCWNQAVDNEFFIGTKKLLLATQSSYNPSITEIYDPNLHTEKNISSVAVSKNNPNVVYYSTDSYWWDTNVDPLTPSMREGIFKATRTGTNWSIEDITNNLRTHCVNGYCGLPTSISDITVDPKNENRIWITLGGLWANEKVYHSEDAGATWQNLTTSCLPNLPVLSIIYQDSADNRIYIGTDAGVYYRDDVQTEWAKYGVGGPPCMINDLEIDLKHGKMVAATHGRGIWEVALIGYNNVGISKNTVQKNILRAIPNPSSGDVRFTYQGQTIPLNTYIVIRNQLGVRVKTVLWKEDIILDTQGLAPGTYFYSLETNQGVWVSPQILMIAK